MYNDDYEFDCSENSRLSTIFGFDGGSSSNSKLTYKAPKQPNKSASSVSTSDNSKTFHKYIKLYQLQSGFFYGKFIIALINGKNHVQPRILIYQTKNNIIIDTKNSGGRFLSYTNNYTLIFIGGAEQFKLEFENGKNLDEFVSEYQNNGGVIEIFQQSTYVSDESKDSQSNMNSKSESLSGESEYEVPPSQCDKSERNSISSRLERMGIPLLPSIPISKNKLNNITLPTVNERKDMQFWNGNVNMKNVQEIGQITKDEQVSVVNSKWNITEEQIDLLNSALIKNQTKNSQLMAAIQSLTSKLTETVPSRGCDDDKNEIKKHESKIKSLQLKTENLQSELNKLYKKYGNESEVKIMCDTSTETDSSGSSSRENVTSLLITILSVIESFPFTDEEINKLKIVKNEIKDESLKISVEPYFEFVERKSTLENYKVIQLRRKSFVSELKKIMNNMYQNVHASEQKQDMKLLAEEMKVACSEILMAYDNSVNYKNNCESFQEQNLE